MYSFTDLCQTGETTFSYLLGVLKKWPSDSDITPSYFVNELGKLVTVEDQSETMSQTKSGCVLTRRYVMPTAPVTLAPEWSPFPLACQALKQILKHGRSDERQSSAYAIFAPELALEHTEATSPQECLLWMSRKVGDHCLPLENIHAQHFLWLLKLTLARAAVLKKPVFLAGRPGGHYDDMLEHDAPGETQFRLLRAGYLYPSRVPQGARYQYLTDPAARAARQKSLEIELAGTAEFTLPSMSEN